MHEQLLVALAAIVVVGVAAQWAAALTRLPSILLLLLAGVAVGHFGGLVDPDAQFPDLIAPAVSLAVALILFEGGLGLRFGQIVGLGGVVRRLVTVGVLLTWLIGWVAIAGALDLDTGVAALGGAILVVSGPTVVGPLLRQIRARLRVASVLRWEAIVIDPIGALLAALVFEVVVSGGGRPSMEVAARLGGFVAVGTLLGLAGAAVLVLVLARHLIPYYLQTGIALTAALAVFVAADLAVAESGLLAVTVMGVALANQPWVEVDHIVEFKENLRVLLISAVFVVLAARLDPADIGRLGWGTGAVVAALVLVARPLAVWLATIGSALDVRERVFLALVAPRGIVAALVASLLAFELEETGLAGAADLVPLTFLVIGVAAAFYGLAAPLAARRLGVADPDPQGVLILGAGPVEREVGLAVQNAGFRVILAATARSDEYAARMLDLETFYGDILGADALDHLDLSGIGRVLAMTPNHEFNSLALERLVRTFGRSNTYQLPPEPDDEGERTRHLSGRPLFDGRHPYHRLAERLSGGSSPKATDLTAEFGFDQLLGQHDGALVLFVVDGGRLEVAAGAAPAPGPGPGRRVLFLPGDGAEPGQERAQASPSAAYA